MAKEKCDLGKEVFSEIEQIMEDEFKEKEHKVETVISTPPKYKQFYKNLREYLISNAKEDMIGLESVTDYIDRQYSGNEAERLKLATQLRSLFNKYPTLRQMLHPQMILQVTMVSNYNMKEFYTSDNRWVIENFPVPLLKYLLNHAMEYASSKQITNPFRKPKKGAIGFVRGQLDRISLNIGTPYTNRFKDTTGAVFTMYQASQEFVGNISKNISRYLNKDIRGDRKYGLNDVFLKIKNLALAIPKSTESTKDELARVFTRYMQGQVIIKNGKMYHYQSWVPVRDKDGRIMRYPDTNDVMYDWADPVPIEEAMPNLDFKINNRIISTFESQKIRASKIYKEIWTNTIKDYQRQEKELLRILKKSYFPKGTDLNTVRKIIFEEDWKKYVDSAFHERIQFLKETFTEYSLFEPFLYAGQAQVPQKGKNKNAWPIKYHVPLMKHEWLIKEQEAINNVTTAENEYADDPTSENEAILNEAKSILKYRRRQANRMLGIADNSINDAKVLTRGQAASFKSITNDFDLAGPMKRDDESLIYDYLRDNASQIARNDLINKVLIAYALDGDNLIDKDEVIELWKTTMNRTDTQSKGVLGLDMSPANLSRWINWAGKRFKISISPSRLDSMLKRISQWFTFLKLAGVSTAEVNATAAILKINQFSEKALKTAIEEYNANPALWDDLIAESGILSFGDFFSKGLVSNLTGTHELADRNAKNVVLAYLTYYKEVSRLGRAQAEKNLKASIEIEVKTIPSISRLKQLDKALRADRINAMVSKLANFAITKEFKNLQVIETLPDIIFDKGATFLERWSSYTLNSASLPTMGGTEKNMRTQSFVMAALRLRDKGIFRGDFFNMSDRQRREIINTGRLYSDLLDFGLSQQSVGRIFRGSFGSLRGRFKFWATQKWRFDLDILRNYYRSLADPNRGKSIDWKAFYQMGKTFIKFIPDMFFFGTTAGSKLKKLKADNHIAAQYAHFMAYSVPMTILLDVFLFGPLIRKGAGRIVGQFMPFISSKGLYKHAAGFSSDMITIFLSLPILFALKGDTGDDEEETRDFFDRLFRASWEGFGTAYAISVAELVWTLLQEDEDQKLDKSQEFLNKNVPAGTEKLLNIRRAMNTMDDILEE